MKKSASEIINDLEMRIARLERQSSSNSEEYENLSEVINTIEYGLGNLPYEQMYNAVGYHELNALFKALPQVKEELEDYRIKVERLNKSLDASLRRIRDRM